MKKIITTFLIVFSVSLFSQTPNAIGFMGGLNLSRAYTYNYVEPNVKLGGFVGIDYRSMITNNFSITPGIVFSQEGVKEKITTPILASVTMGLNYLDVPVAFSYNNNSGSFTIGGLLIPGVLVGGETSISTNGTTVSNNTKDVLKELLGEDVNTFNFGIGMHIGFRISEFEIFYRTKVGLTDMLKYNNGSTLVSTIGLKYNLPV